MPEINQELLRLLGDRTWRLNNLYWITNEKGERVQFRLNWAQQEMYKTLHYLNLILKARQLGFTTFIQIFMLDMCLFNSNVRAGTIAHTLEDAKIIFRDKVKYPYDNLPEQIKAAIPKINDNNSELVLGNNSSIRVGTSLRSGTLQALHISEYGKICAKFPEKAREVRTGALNTIQAGQIAFIESTAEGQDGDFFDLCEMARSKQRRQEIMTPLDFKFAFFPWWRNPEYRLDGGDLAIYGEQLREYFNKLEDTHGIILSPGQKHWYAKKMETQLGDMKREFPSTPDEAFEAAIEGAYYGDEIAKAELDGRIGKHYFKPSLPVHTSWDIGRGDHTAIWFWQINGQQIGLIDFYQDSGHGAPYYVKELVKLAKDRGYRYGVHYVPHDAKVEEWGTERTRVEQLLQYGVKPLRVVPWATIEDGINAVRAIFPKCWFDEEHTQEGLKSLRNYRKEWDDVRGCWRDTPRHDWASDGADSFRYLALAYRPPKTEVKPVAKPIIKDPTKPATASITLQKLFEDREKNSDRRSGMI